MAVYCFSCQTEMNYVIGQVVGRRDTCPSCDADVHCCLNCAHHDIGSYNECRESQAERVVEKDRSNFCDYFAFREGKGSGDGSNVAKSKEDALKKLDDLFK